jgi:phage terminase Nu1 subunit (DNA packaging protein)
MSKKKPKPEKPRIIGIKQVAAALNLTASRVQQLVQEGLPKKLRGKYDKDECTGWYIRYLQALVEKKAIVDEGGRIFASEREERLRQIRADADLTEIKLARQRGQLVLIDDVEKEISDLVLTTKARVLAVAPRLAPELVGETSRVMVQAKIEKSLKEALVQLERTELGTKEENDAA